jgi:hypothetical protein
MINIYSFINGNNLLLYTEIETDKEVTSLTNKVNKVKNIFIYGITPQTVYLYNNFLSY